MYKLTSYKKVSRILFPHRNQCDDDNNVPENSENCHQAHDNPGNNPVCDHVLYFNHTFSCSCGG